MQIGEFDSIHEATPVVHERLLEEVNLATKLPTAKVSFHTGKDIEIVKKLTSPEGDGGSTLKGTETLHTSPAHTEHSIEGPTSIQLAVDLAIGSFGSGSDRVRSVRVRFGLANVDFGSG